MLATARMMCGKGSPVAGIMGEFAATPSRDGKSWRGKDASAAYFPFWARALSAKRKSAFTMGLALIGPPGPSERNSGRGSLVARVLTVTIRSSGKTSRLDKLLESSARVHDEPVRSFVSCCG